MANLANPHGQAFQRWSIPEIVTEDSSLRRQNQSFALAPTIRGDGPAIEALKQPPPSFRVYTPSTSRPAHLRPGHVAANEDDGINARVLLKWTGIGIVAGFGVLAALVLILNFADDSAQATNARAAMAANINTVQTAAPPPVQTATPAAQAVTEVELAPAPAPKAKKKKAKKPQPTS